MQVGIYGSGRRGEQGGEKRIPFDMRNCKGQAVKEIKSLNFKVPAESVAVATTCYPASSNDLRFFKHAKG